MIKKTALILLFNIAIFSSLFAQKNYDFNIICQQAYGEIAALKINAALATIEKANKQNANNLILPWLESYIDLASLLFNEDAIVYEQKSKRIDARIDELKKGPEASPFYHFLLSDVYLHRAIIELRYAKNMSAGWDIKKAFGHIKQNQKLYPTFTPNLMIYGTLEAALGTIPNSYKWLTSILGIKGSIKEGMAKIKLFNSSNNFYSNLMKTESTLLVNYLQYFIENKKEETIHQIKTSNLDFVNNHLLAFMAANLFINNKKNEDAIAIIKKVNKSTDYLSTSIWDMELGLASLHKLDIENAIIYLQSFCNKYNGKAYLKDIYQKLSWAYLLQGNMPMAKKQRDNVLLKGSAETDQDKQALKEAKTNTWPNIILLKARLLNDGGNNAQALDILLATATEKFVEEKDILEYNYRLARIYDDMSKSNEAIKFYKITIQLGSNKTLYFAARAALQIGMIYEKNNNKPEAINFYNQCLEMDNHDFKNSLDQKAKAGVARCKGE
jgi:Tetratricopeptide repeat